MSSPFHILHNKMELLKGRIKLSLKPQQGLGSILGGSNQHGMPCHQPPLSTQYLEQDRLRASTW
jgi:hypothetical protein